ncbi:MAG: ROK family protein [Bellilinea sp.]
MQTFVVTDIGGTQIRAAVFQAGNPSPIVVKKIRTRDKLQTPIERMIGLIKEIWPENTTVNAIVVAVPGYLDINTGVIFEAPNVPGWIDLPLRDLLEEEFHTRVLLGNDANLAAIGEWRYGAGIGYDNLLYLTISTGIGGGAIINGKLMTGARGLAGEFGHFTIVPNGPLCGCGHRGHLEAVASGTAIAKYVSERIALGAESSLSSISNPSAEDVSQAALAGDALAMQALHQAGTYIGHTLADYLNIFNPSIVILGGGVIAAGSLILDPIKSALRDHVLGLPYLEHVLIVTASLGDNVGLIGGLALAETFLPDR